MIIPQLDSQTDCNSSSQPAINTPDSHNANPAHYPKILTKQIKSDIKKFLSLEYGMSPYNACIASGLEHSISKKIAEKLEASYIFGSGIDDIAEQEGASVRRRIRWLSDKAGLAPGSKGATKLISCNVYVKGEGSDLADANSMTKDFIDVQDTDLQLQCVKEINRMTGVDKAQQIQQSQAHVNSNSININIRVARPEDTSTRLIQGGQVGQ